MLTIRFQRVGRKNDPAFRIVITEKRSKPASGELEILGSFHPKTKETRIKRERILYWLSKGAKASPRAHNLFIAQGIIQGTKIDVSKRAKNVAASATEMPSGVSPAPAAADTPTEIPAAAPAAVVDSPVAAG